MPRPALQATTLAHRLLRAVRGPGYRGGVLRASPVGAASGPVVADGPGRAFAAVGASSARPGPVVDDVPVADPGSAAEVVADAALARVLARARAAGAPSAAVGGLADAWVHLTPVERRTVDRPLGDGRAGPVRIGGAPARQSDGTTCGSAVLALLAAAGDPLLALWLATGRLVPGHLPPELRGVPAAAVTSADGGVRLSGLQRALKRASTRAALGPLPWPAALGTPPWGAARTARFPGVAWDHVLVDDTDAVLVDAVLDHADAALAAGVPVPLFTGGDLGSGVAAAVPRHVVLLVPVVAAVPADLAGPDGAGYAVYEPGAGRVHQVGRDRLARPGGPHPALGGWSHVCWAVLPRAARPAARPAL